MPRGREEDEEAIFGPSVHVEPICQLWCSILLQAIADADGPRPGLRRPRPRDRTEGYRKARSGAVGTGTVRDIDPARSWLRLASPSLAIALMAVDVTHDAWRTRMLPHLERRWRKYDSERALHQAITADEAGDEDQVVVLLERAARLEMAGSGA